MPSNTTTCHLCIYTFCTSVHSCPAIYTIHLVNKEAMTKIYNYNTHKQFVIHRTIALPTYPSLGDDVAHHPPKGEATTGGVLTGTTTPDVAALPAGRL